MTWRDLAWAGVGAGMGVQVVSSDSNDVNVDYEESSRLLTGWMARNENPRVIIATGFIARDKNGRPTTLKR